MSYTLTQAEFVAERRKLRTAVNRLNRARATFRALNGHQTPDDVRALELIARRVIEVAEACTGSEGLFDQKGWPDSWAEWVRASDDARTVLHYDCHERAWI